MNLQAVTLLPKELPHQPILLCVGAVLLNAENVNVDSTKVDSHQHRQLAAVRVKHKKVYVRETQLHEDGAQGSTHYREGLLGHGNVVIPMLLEVRWHELVDAIEPPVVRWVGMVDVVHGGVVCADCGVDREGVLAALDQPAEGNRARLDCHPLPAAQQSSPPFLQHSWGVGAEDTLCNELRSAPHRSGCDAVAAGHSPAQRAAEELGVAEVSIYSTQLHIHARGLQVEDFFVRILVLPRLGEEGWRDQDVSQRCRRLRPGAGAKREPPRQPGAERSVCVVGVWPARSVQSAHWRRCEHDAG